MVETVVKKEKKPETKQLSYDLGLAKNHLKVALVSNAIWNGNSGLKEGSEAQEKDKISDLSDRVFSRIWLHSQQVQQRLHHTLAPGDILAEVDFNGSSETRPHSHHVSISTV